ncbi:hypothetical protein KC19_9G152300 [Ceratodon purpureus]|uniref:Uncharacterized protein n=1 Tax=Ceratodon purpureus TaxID=3225 RepID=A0A8T0GUC4_CERPU|nr:hypothetical protein KC19_9G152300 [Ceratodon purpureus]
MELTSIEVQYNIQRIVGIRYSNHMGYASLGSASNLFLSVDDFVHRCMGGFHATAPDMQRVAPSTSELRW